MKRALAIANAKAGSGDHRILKAAIDELDGSFDVEVAKTSNPDELDTALAGRGDCDLIIVAGGDGSLHAVVAALHRSGALGKVVIGLLPMGTGNDFARGAGIPLDAVEAARRLNTDRKRPVDLIVDDNGAIVINAVHLGATAEAGQAAQIWKSRLGKVGYLIGGVIAGFSHQGLRERIEVDGSVVAHKRVASVSINSGAYVGGGTPLAPGAEPDDGRLDIGISYAYGSFSRIVYAAQVRLGRHEQREDVQVLQGKSVRVSGDPYVISADGEIAENITDRTWTLHRGAVQMVLPVPPEPKP